LAPFGLLIYVLVRSNSGADSQAQPAGFWDSTKVVSKDGSNDSRRTDGTASLAFHRGDPQHIMLYNDQPNAIQKIFRTADEEYQKLELRYTKRTPSFDKGASVSYTITILPFKQELKGLEERVWSQVGTVLNFPGQMDSARTLLPMRGSLFPFGTEEISIHLSRINNQGGNLYRWRVTKPGDPGTGQWFQGKKLPEEYARFWDQN